MKQPPEKDTDHAQGMKTPPEYDAATWARAQLRDQIQRSGAAPETGQPNGRQRREAGVAPLADLQAEPAKTARHHGNEPSTGQQITAIACRAEAVGRRADGHALAARSVDCECQAQAGVPCGPSGDHLARYLRATQSGALTKDALKHVIADLDVIAPRALIQPPSERTAAGIDAGQATGQTVPSQIDTGMTADPASAPAHSAPRGRSGAPALEGEALPRGYGGASATHARREGTGGRVLTDGFKCTADPCCWHPAPSANGICAQHRWQARLAQMRYSPSAAVRAAGWLLTQLHQGGLEADGDGLQRRGPSQAAAREVEPG